MNRPITNHSEIAPTQLDRILTTEEELIPSSGFLASVMERMHEEARIPAPIPFPWKRAIPGILLAGGVFGWGAFEFARRAIPAVQALALTQPHLPVAVVRPLEEAGWVALALAISLASWLLSRRIAGRGGLL
jgi:hypothetical protein